MTEKQKLAEALNPSFVVELPPNTKSVKYNVPMAMMPLSDWEKIEAALMPCEGERAAMAAEVERLRGAIDGAIKQLKEEGDRDYCRALDIADKNCKGAQYKLESGEFSNDDLKWHCKLHELIGKHRGIYYAMNLLHRLQSALAGGKEG